MYVIINSIMTSTLWGIMDLLKVNPTLRTSMLPVSKFRMPSPASQPKFTLPTTDASNISKNQYYQRDSRRTYPATIVISPTPSSIDITNDNPLPILSKIRHIYEISEHQPPRSLNTYFPIKCKY